MTPQAAWIDMLGAYLGLYTIKKMYDILLNRMKLTWELGEVVRDGKGSSGDSTQRQIDNRVR